MISEKEYNYAFVDMQNIICGVERLGWLVDFEKLFKYLSYKHRAVRIFLFVGYVEKFSRSYRFLEKIGYLICYKPVVVDNLGRPKANIDADMVLKAVLEKENYTKAIILSGDGDFYSLVAYLFQENKLEVVLCPSMQACSSLLKRHAPGHITDMSSCRNQISLAT